MADSKEEGGACMKIADVFHDLPTLETKRLILRKFTMNDAQDMFEYSSVSDVSKYVPCESYQLRMIVAVPNI